jgi:hypothetical protein
MANFAYENGTQADVKTGVYTHHIIIPELGGKSQVEMPIAPPRCKNGAILSPAPSMVGMTPKKAGSRRRSIGPFALLKRQMAGFSVFIGGGGDVGSGNPFAPKPGSNVSSGYYIGKSSTMQLTAEIVNYDPVAKDLYLTLDVEWVSGKTSELLDVGMGALSAVRCDDKEKGIVHPPKDRAITYKGEEWTITQDGYFINFTPHIHDGGTKVEVFLNGKNICQSRAVYGEQKASGTGQSWQTIVDYTPCNDAVAIKKGDQIYVTSEYDLTKYKL